jgi:hypothetical protein
MTEAHAGVKGLSDTSASGEKESDQPITQCKTSTHGFDQPVRYLTSRAYKTKHFSRNNQLNITGRTIFLCELALSILIAFKMIALISNSPFAKYARAIKQSPPGLYNWRLILTVIMYALAGMPKGTVANRF